LHRARIPHAPILPHPLPPEPQIATLGTPGTPQRPQTHTLLLPRPQRLLPPPVVTPSWSTVRLDDPVVCTQNRPPTFLCCSLFPDPAACSLLSCCARDRGSRSCNALSLHNCGKPPNPHLPLGLPQLAMASLLPQLCVLGASSLGWLPALLLALSCTWVSSPPWPQPLASLPASVALGASSLAIFSLVLTA
jgi:hypothetical protein